MLQRRVVGRVATAISIASLCSHCLPTLGYPYSAQQLAADSTERPAEALTHYFTQNDADSRVCDLSRREPVLSRFDREMIDAMLEKLLAGALNVRASWECLKVALPQLPQLEQRQAVVVLGGVPARDPK